MINSYEKVLKGTIFKGRPYKEGYRGAYVRVPTKYIGRECLIIIKHKKYSGKPIKIK